MQVNLVTRYQTHHLPAKLAGLDVRVLSWIEWAESGFSPALVDVHLRIKHPWEVCASALREKGCCPYNSMLHSCHNSFGYDTHSPFCFVPLSTVCFAKDTIVTGMPSLGWGSLRETVTPLNEFSIIDSFSRQYSHKRKTVAEMTPLFVAKQSLQYALCYSKAGIAASIEAVIADSHNVIFKDNGYDQQHNIMFMKCVSRVAPTRTDYFEVLARTGFDNELTFQIVETLVNRQQTIV